MRTALLPLLALVLIASAAPPAARAETGPPTVQVNRVERTAQIVTSARALPPLVLSAMRVDQAPALMRRYWPVPIDSLAVGRAKHTHVEVRGRVSAVRQEDDGDLHIVLQSLTSTTFIVGECIPSLPCQRPRVGDTIRLRGISRRDPEHPWHEVHPVEALLH